MTEKTAWADLPNAKYIDLVLASMNKNPAACDAARAMAWAAARDAAWRAARGAAWDAAWGASRGASRGEVWDAARDTAKEEAWTAVLALIAWDDCGYLFEETPEEVKMLALLGNQAAVLLYPACVALQNIKELEK